MDSQLKAYLDKLTAANCEQWDWGTIQLESALYLTHRHPPQHYVTSVRTIVFKGDEVLVVSDPDILHVLPGGRRELGETYVETAQRECLEETRWQIEVGQMIAVTHCHHLNPKPANYTYPYPDFFQIIYVARATIYHPDRVIEDDYVTGSEFRSIVDVQKLELTPNQHILLKTALDVKLPE